MKGTCKACGEPCNVVLIDFGIGSYEFWGAQGTDIQIEAVSDCCEDTVVDDDNKEITVQMVKEEEQLDRL